MDPRTRAAARDSAISVWLRADLEMLLKRTSRRNHRPLLKRGNPREILDNLIQERYPVYAEADIVVQSQDGPPEATVDNLLRSLTHYLSGHGNLSSQGTAAEINATAAETSG
jgi:shikimate kinase